MLKWILLSIYILSILTVIFIERKRPTEALLWVFILICLPYFGTLLYLIFGNTTWIKWKKQKSEKIEIPKQTVPISSLSSEDEQVMHFNYVYNQSPITSYTNIQTYTDGKSHYEQLFHDIDAAKSSIYIEFYTIHNDIIGQNFIQHLTAKAKQGLDVFILCDSFANLNTPHSFYTEFKKANGKIIRVKPYLTHYRLHRKIVVIDQEIAYIGGMNIGKQYANLAEKKNPWRDTQVRLQGECVQNLMYCFLQDWLDAQKNKNKAETLHYIQNRPKKQYEPTKNLCQFIMGGVDTDKESVKMVYLSMIRSAKRSIQIQSPYFIPDTSILDALKTAAASGIHVELMIPGIEASFFLDPVTTYYTGQLLQYGAKVYKYNGYIHAKTMSIDDELCAIGSVNMDMRSLQVDDEICGIFYENQFVEHYRNIYETDKQHSIPYSLQQFNNRGNAEKMKEGFFLLFAPLM